MIRSAQYREFCTGFEIARYRFAGNEVFVNISGHWSEIDWEIEFDLIKCKNWCISINT
jgi:hypothetical protein